MLVARSGEHVLSWHLARSETSRAYARLLRGIAPPEMVVTDGGPGFARVRRWLFASPTKVFFANASY